MKVLITFVITLIVSSGVFCDVEIKDDEGVLVLTKSNFEEALKKYDYVLVEFCKLNHHYHIYKLNSFQSQYFNS